jgi:hypothetical protein
MGIAHQNPDSMTEPEVVAVPAPPPQTSVWEDFIDIFYAPADVFRRRQNGNFWIPLLVVVLASAVLAFTNSGVMQPIFDAEFARASAAAIKSNPRVTQEIMDAQRPLMEGMQRYGIPLFVAVLIIVVGFMTWIVGKLVDARQSVRAAMIVAAYSYVPRAVEGVLAGVQGLLLDPSKLNSRYSLQIGPARFLDPDATSPFLLAFAGRLDLITLWVTVLLAIGLAVTGKVPRNRAIVGGVLFWLVGSIPAFLQALQQA